MPESLGASSSGSIILIIDSWPLMEWLKNRHPAASHFNGRIELARSGQRTLLLSSISLGEMYYNSWKEWNQDRAEEVLAAIAKLPIHVIHPTESDVLAAARIKGRYQVSYADAFVALLAIQFAAPVLTGDPDFLKLQADGVLYVEWIGA